MPKVRIVFATTGFAGVRAYLAEALPEAEVATIDASTLLRDGVEAEVLTPAMSRIDGALMDRIRGLRLIQQWGVGLEGVDLAAATARRVPVARVASAGSGNAESVAEWAIMAAIALGRRLDEAQRVIRAGAGWGAPMGRALLGRNVGIVGVGGLGAALAIRLRPFGVHLAGVARRANPALAERLGMDWIGALDRLPELLGRSDFLFLCLPLTGETRRLIDAAALAQLPDGACLINVGRGGLVDPKALIEALDSGRLAGAALDVFEQEPLDPQSPLLARPNLLATPHVAGVTDASYRGIAERLAANVRRLVKGEPLEDCVNWDAVQPRG
jgi:phosphoglycerate dehydrogenase-like enzyme